MSELGTRALAVCENNKPRTLGGVLAEIRGIARRQARRSVSGTRIRVYVWYEGGQNEDNSAFTGRSQNPEYQTARGRSSSLVVNEGAS